MKTRLPSRQIPPGNSWACFCVLEEYGYEGVWMPLQSIMNFSFPPPVGHRVLFVLVADGIQAVCPSLDYLKCFFLSQLVAILLAFEAIRRWGSLFVREELSIVAQLLLTVIMIPTLHCYDFYDFGVVFFFSACLYRRYLQPRDNASPGTCLRGRGCGHWFDPAAD